MTLESFDNYKQNLLYLHSKSGLELVRILSNGNCKAEDERFIFNISTMFICSIIGYRVEEDNCVSPDSMKELTNSLNKIHRTNYCVDYIID